ncbi:MAG: DEAD/DEAH box helicase family protein, partial [Proteobacteria bacterium]|nr:DEAD/DEAH box helicase family protein [Pseudomonadota bacterium]
MSVQARVQLRHYQTAAIDAVRSRYRTEDRALMVLATGAGKTFTALTMAALTISRGGRVLWLAHRKELVEQPLRAWEGVPGLATGVGGVVKGGQRDYGADLVCASVQTVGRAPLAEGSTLRQVYAAGVPRLVVVDEAHHYADDGRGQFAALLQACAELAGETPQHWLGLTATPERTDRRGLTGLWGTEPAYVYGYQDAISEGYLVPPRVVRERLELSEDAADALALARKAGDDESAEVARVLLDADVV